MDAEIVEEIEKAREKRRKKHVEKWSQERCFFMKDEIRKENRR